MSNTELSSFEQLPNLDPATLDGTKTIIFYDNEPYNTRDVASKHSNIFCVTVDDKLPNTLAEQTNSKKYIDLEEFKDNIYAQALKHFKLDDKVIVGNGITEDHLSKLKEWLDSYNTDKKRHILFDWDRTLAVTEGFYSYKYIQDLIKNEQKQQKQANNITSKLSSFISGTKTPATFQFSDKVTQDIDSLLYDQYKFIMGGEERLEKLKEFFQNNSKNVVYAVITNNSSANPTDGQQSDDFKIFASWYRDLFNKKNLANLWYSGDTVDDFNPNKERPSKGALLTKERRIIGGNLKNPRRKSQRKPRRKSHRKSRR